MLPLIPKPVSVVFVKRADVRRAVACITDVQGIATRMPPFTVKSALIPLTLPFIVGASVETLIVSLPASPFTVTAPLMERTLTVSLSSPALSVVVPLVALT